MTESNHNNKSRIDEYIENNDCQINESVPVIIKGEKKNLSVYRLPTDLLYYNIRNGRFAAEYRNEIKKEGGVLIPEEKEDAKKIQNLLWNLNVNESKLTYQDIQQRGQWKAGIITEDGYVIDGNRRMSILSKLFDDTSNDEFKFIKVGRLNANVEDKDLWKLEAGIQLGKEEIVRYGAMNELLKLEEAKSIGISNDEIAKTLYGFNDVNEIKLKLDRLELIKKYLIFLNDVDNFKKAEDKVEHFKEFQKIIKIANDVQLDPDTKIAIRKAVFCLIKQNIQHMELRKIGKMIKRELDQALEYIISLSEDCDGVQTTSTLNEDEDDVDIINSKLIAAKDILEADVNKDQIGELLRRAALNLDTIDYQNHDLENPRLKEIIQKILDHMKKLEKFGE